MSADPSKCRAIIPPSTDACGGVVTHRVTFKDGDKVLVCGDCALRFRELIGASVRLEKLDGVTR